jgi:hypothetical protein
MWSAVILTLDAEIILALVIVAAIAVGFGFSAAH